MLLLMREAIRSQRYNIISYIYYLVYNYCFYNANFKRVGHYNLEFTKKNSDYYFNSNTLSNAVKHMAATHYLEEQGDIWRMLSDKLVAAQASGKS